MPRFSTEPPPEARRPGIRLLRTPAGRAIVAVITSDDVVGTPTHFYKHRTIPCEGNDCEPCRAGYSWRWHGYVSCVDETTHEHVLFEFTAKASDYFKAYKKQHGSLRGCLFHAARAGQRYNAAVIIRCRPADLAGRDLPEGLNIPPLLCHIWNVPVTATELTERHPDRLGKQLRLHPDDNGQDPVPTNVS